MFKKTLFYPLTPSLMWSLGLVLSLALMLSLAPPARSADFTLTDTAGKAHKLSQYKGKWVLVNFWATWCPPCLDEIPDLVDLHENRKNNLVVLGVALDYRNGQQVKDFADTLLVSYPIILGDRKMAAQIGPVDGLPTTYLYNPQGTLVAHQLGPITRGDVENFIRGAGRSARK